MKHNHITFSAIVGVDYVCRKVANGKYILLLPILKVCC